MAHYRLVVRRSLVQAGLSGIGVFSVLQII